MANNSNKTHKKYKLLLMQLDLNKKTSSLKKKKEEIITREKYHGKKHTNFH